MQGSKILNLFKLQGDNYLKKTSFFFTQFNWVGKKTALMILMVFATRSWNRSYSSRHPGRRLLSDGCLGALPGQLQRTARWI